MAKVVTDDRHYKAIADTIRKNVPIEEYMTPADMPANINTACGYNHEVGFAAGAQSGADEGYSVGYSEGYVDGVDDGKEEGYADGYSKGNTEGYTKGKKEGYETGYQAGVDSGFTQEDMIEAFEQGDAAGYGRGYADGKGEGSAQVQTVLNAIVSDTNIGDYSNDRVTSLPSYAFAYRRSMTSVYLPKVTQISAQAFSNCTGLVKAELPSLTSMTSTANFGACSALQRVDLGNVSGIPASTFSNCSALNVLVLRRTSVCNLANVNAFAGTPFASGGTGGKIYVPSALIGAYQTATNWSTLAVEVFALEGSEYA